MRWHVKDLVCIYFFIYDVIILNDLLEVVKYFVLLEKDPSLLFILLLLYQDFVYL
jgi:hypothetical protein